MSSPTTIAFDGKNAAAQRVADQIAARLVTRISEETRRAMRALIVRMIQDGVPVYDAARLIESMIGLSGPQALAAAAYRVSLIDSGLPLARVETLVAKYVAKKIRERAKLIAHNEVMTALNRGQLESAKQARAAGWLSADAVKTWIVTNDDRLCPECEPMDGVEVPLNAKFQTAEGEVDCPPLHVACRCNFAAHEKALPEVA
jgi:SPP1 gp7 family putative phage head morphogenesis protein